MPDEQAQSSSSTTQPSGDGAAAQAKPTPLPVPSPAPSAPASGTGATVSSTAPTTTTAITPELIERITRGLDTIEQFNRAQTVAAQSARVAQLASDFHDPNDALKHLDAAELAKLDDTGVRAALNKLGEEKPYLRKSPGKVEAGATGAKPAGGNEAMNARIRKTIRHA